MLEFWGVEVKSGESIKCAPKKKRYLHLSKACLVKPKKEKNDSVRLFVKFDDKKLVLGTLSADKCPQISYDVVFEKEYSDISDLFEMDYPVSKENDKLKDEVATLVPVQDEAKADLKSNAKAVAEELKSDESYDDSLDDPFFDDDFDIHSEAQVGKKREVGSSITTHAPEKKAKLVTPSGGKKTGADVKEGSGHTATLHPPKQAAKIPAMDKQKQVPKSGESVSCKSCSKTFNSENALQSHTKAKHSE
ncbi:Histone deacetylase HDT2 [Acorus calamus]|uniref:Histone deacetylase HDT2 n=1 Tax=Acorus calamus TaxID=4465 RepID=A0AAV9DJT5_ACOCL|nr:Histone deacetylase HDT2 [Acorus calamus]